MSEDDFLKNHILSGLQCFSAAHPGTFMENMTPDDQLFLFFGTLSEQEVCRALWRIMCTAAATDRLEVPCMMPCNTPLYKSMWRLSSLLYWHAQDVTSFLFFTFFPSSSPPGTTVLFSPKVHWLFIIV